MSNYRIIERTYKTGKSTFLLQKKHSGIDIVGYPYEEWKNVKKPTGVLWFKEPVTFDSMEKMNDWIGKNLKTGSQPDKVVLMF